MITRPTRPTMETVRDGGQPGSMLVTALWLLLVVGIVALLQWDDARQKAECASKTCPPGLTAVMLERPRRCGCEVVPR